jgi:hypothetical protein
MRFVLLAVVETKKDEHATALVDRIEKYPFVTVKEVRLLKLETPKQMPSELYLPCPRDTFLTRLGIIEDEGGEVYFGRCRNGHQLVLSATRNPRRHGKPRLG